MRVFRSRDEDPALASLARCRSLLAVVQERREVYEERLDMTTVLRVEWPMHASHVRVTVSYNTAKDDSSRCLFGAGGMEALEKTSELILAIAMYGTPLEHAYTHTDQSDVHVHFVVRWPTFETHFKGMVRQLTSLRLGSRARNSSLGSEI